MTAASPAPCPPLCGESNELSSSVHMACWSNSMVWLRNRRWPFPSRGAVVRLSAWAAFASSGCTAGRTRTTSSAKSEHSERTRNELRDSIRKGLMVRVHLTRPCTTDAAHVELCTPRSSSFGRPRKPQMQRMRSSHLSANKVSSATLSMRASCVRTLEDASTEATRLELTTWRNSDDMDCWHELLRSAPSTAISSTAPWWARERKSRSQVECRAARRIICEPESRRWLKSASATRLDPNKSTATCRSLSRSFWL
mmetsp:Transcript_12036/g.38505  ORF Transcript_12036/g.38505 Transcript_12036/m.38505 type:complete len:254 (+) Transcript_12036:475-1236(+)